MAQVNSLSQLAIVPLRTNTCDLLHARSDCGSTCVESLWDTCTRGVATGPGPECPCPVHNVLLLLRFNRYPTSMPPLPGRGRGKACISGVTGHCFGPSRFTSRWEPERAQACSPATRRRRSPTRRERRHRRDALEVTYAYATATKLHGYASFLKPTCISHGLHRIEQAVTRPLCSLAGARPPSQTPLRVSRLSHTQR